MKIATKYQLLLLLGLMVWNTESFGQYYLNSIGMRLGHTSALTFKSFINKNDAMEFMLSGRDRGMQLTVLHEQHRSANIEFDGSFFLYWGFGGHIGFERSVYFNPEWELFDVFSLRNTISRTHFALGADAIVGLEYRMIVLPLTLALDVKPYLNFVGFRGVEAKFHDIAFSIKYAF